MAEVFTTKGYMDESLLERREFVDRDDDNERTVVVEYWLNGENVHRSVHITLKRSPSIFSEVGGFDG